MALYEPVSSRRRIAGQLLYFCSWLAITAVGAYLHASPTGHGTHEELGLPPCPSALFFSRPCPGCGLTTSWTAFIHGDFAFAFHAHPLGPFLYLAFTATAFMALRGWIRSERMSTDTPQFNRALMILAVVFLSFGIVRMATTSNYRSLQDIAAMK
ncbi:MAG TPA: DUF2752 domain-containing protein [Fimbriimonadaceae bacterium]|nr:DUF2752 domain-containing protein [Fimbriimonadaceae bacterium]